VAALLVVVFVGWRWWDETQLWNAAKNHYLSPLQVEENGRLKAIIDACESKLVEDGVMVFNSAVQWEFPSLARGHRNLASDGLLEWARVYEFYLVIPLRADGGFVEAVCEWNPEWRQAEIIQPDGI
jgi:hypothetical protein